MSKGPAGTNNVALTIDDGYCDECVSAYVDFAEHSGIHLTFSPNGIYRQVWEPYGSRLRSLSALGQVQIANHTWSHQRITGMAASSLRSDIERNEEWIEETFGTTARPWFRPPYGVRNGASDEAAAGLGYTKILLWNGTLGDATVETPEEIMALADEHFQAGKIVLGHANHPTVTRLFPDLERLMDQRGLKAVTLDEMFSTSRAVG